MEEEIWKPVKGYETKYLVSNLGRIMSLNYRGKGAPHIVKPRVYNGYCRLQFKKEGRIVDCAVHQLVAIAFIPNPDNKPQIDHIDGNPSNNRVENLRWCTAKENSNNPITLQRKKEYFSAHPTFLGKSHSPKSIAKMSEYASSRIGEKNSFYGRKHSDESKKKISEYRKSTGIPVLQFSHDGEFIREWPSAKIAAAENNIISPGGITACCKGKRQSRGGYKWRYKDPRPE